MLLLPIGLLAPAAAVAAMPVLDGYATPNVAISCYRRLLTAYTGPLIRVRRSSDNTELDIAYGADNLLNTTALTGFVGSSSGYVTKAYSQVGGDHFVQATAASQPRIVNAGTVETFANGKTSPGMRFSSAQSLARTTPIAQGAITVLASAMRASAYAGAAGYATTDGQDIPPVIAARAAYSGQGLGINMGNSYGPVSDAGKVRINAEYTSIVGFLNGVKQSGVDPFDTSTGAGEGAVIGATLGSLYDDGNPLTLGSYVDGKFYLNGTIQSVVVFPAVLTDAQITSLSGQL